MDIGHLKILILGESGVGKSSLIRRFMDHEYNDQKSTIGLSTRSKATIINGIPYSLDIWDTAGCERFRALSPSFYRDADCILVVYDVSRRETFEKLDSWIEEIERYVSCESVALLFVGQKVDVDRAVTNAEGHRAARKYAALFAEVSAKNDIGVDEAFDMIVRKTLEKRMAVKDFVNTETGATDYYFSATHSRGRVVIDREDNVALEGEMVRFEKLKGNPTPRVTQCNYN